MDAEAAASLHQRHQRRIAAGARPVPTVGMEAQGRGQVAGDAPAAQVGFRQGATDRQRLGPDRLRLPFPLFCLGPLLGFARGQGRGIGRANVAGRDASRRRDFAEGAAALEAMQKQLSALHRYKYALALHVPLECQ